MRLGGVKHQAIGTGAGADQFIEPPILVQPPHPSSGILQPGLPLIGEEDQLICVQGQVVQPLEALAHDRLQDGGGRARVGIDAHQAMPVIRGKQLPVGLHLQAVGPARILRDQGPFITLDPENPSIRNIDHI